MSTRSLQIECLLTPVIDYRDGSVASGYSVYFYSAGTSSAKNIWTEKEKTNPYTSRTLGSDGTVQVYGDGVYKIVIKDTDGTTVYSWDNVKIQHPNIAVLSKSGNYTATADDDYILVGASMTLTLHAASTWTHPLCVKLTGSYTLTIDPNASELIEGASTYTLDTVDSAVWLFTDGSAIYVANATSVSAVDAINLVASVGGSAKLTAKSSTIDIEDNNEYLRQKNAADTDYINLIKVNASDQAQLGAVVKAIELLNTGLTIQDTGGDNTLTIKCNEDLSADKILSLVLGDADRAMTLGGDVTTGGSFTTSDALTLASTDIIPAETVMAFGQNAAPTGWTRLTTGDPIYGTSNDNAMFCFARTGDIAQGGGVNPQATHTHTGPSHTHTLPIGVRASATTTLAYKNTQTSGTFTPTQNIAGGANTSSANAFVSNSGGTGATGSNTAPYYVELILAKKD